MTKPKETAFEELSRICAEQGTNLTALCRELGFNRSTVERWRKADPESLIIYRTMLARLNQIPAQ